VGTRAAQAISKTVAAGVLWLEGGRVAELRFALGSMAPTVRRLRTVEGFLAGKRLSADAIDVACKILEQDVSPIDDIRSTREYRLAVSRNILRRFLAGR
jgi:xanthine dehydrogenase iron-sulfur cluster and FAD-binding subunit A